MSRSPINKVPGLGGCMIVNYVYYDAVKVKKNDYKAVLTRLQLPTHRNGR